MNEDVAIRRLMKSIVIGAIVWLIGMGFILFSVLHALRQGSQS